MEPVGTNPLPRKGRSIKNVGVLLAVSTLLATRPRATVSQARATVIMARTPAAANQSSIPAVGRKPTATATTRTTATASRLWIMLPSTWPASTAGRQMDMVRNRSMMPSVISVATEMAVAVEAEATVSRMMAGVT